MSWPLSCGWYWEIEPNACHPCYFVHVDSASTLFQHLWRPWGMASRRHLWWKTKICWWAWHALKLNFVLCLSSALLEVQFFVFHGWGHEHLPIVASPSRTELFKSNLKAYGVNVQIESDKCASPLMIPTPTFHISSSTCIHETIISSPLSSPSLKLASVPFVFTSQFKSQFKSQLTAVSMMLCQRQGRDPNLKFQRMHVIWVFKKETNARRGRVGMCITHEYIGKRISCAQCQQFWLRKNYCALAWKRFCNFETTSWNLVYRELIAYGRR